MVMPNKYSMYPCRLIPRPNYGLVTLLPCPFIDDSCFFICPIIYAPVTLVALINPLFMILLSYCNYPIIYDTLALTSHVL
jgi:hypothetical protein